MELILDSDSVTGKPKKRLLDRVRDVMRLKHYTLRTERTYCDWITRFSRFHQMHHPAEKSEPEMAEFLTQLAGRETSPHRPKIRPLSALLFLYKEVPKQNEIRRSDVQL